jgi:hypothetical protein
MGLVVFLTASPALLADLLLEDGFETIPDECSEADDGTKCSSNGGDICLAGTCVDTIAPGAPILDPIDEGRIDTTVLITGVAEPASTVAFYADCDLGSNGFDTTTAQVDGNFSLAWLMTVGETCSFYATAEDATGNVSSDSNFVTTTVCDPPVVENGQCVSM